MKSILGIIIIIMLKRAWSGRDISHVIILDIINFFDHFLEHKLSPV